MAVVEISDLNYSKIVEGCEKPIFIDFYSPSCGPCQELLPFLDALDEYGKDEILIAKVDVSRNPKIAQKFAIRAIPLCITIGNDKMVKDYKAGLGDSTNYFKMVDRVLNREKKGFFSKLFG